VALHGCTQTADAFDYGTGWSTLADRLGFVVIFPEQQPSNNPQNCLSWFLPGDTGRECGEALSIRQMVERAVVDFGADRRRVFVTGLSAGGAMASVMLATYPEVFAGGAIIAGLPYGCASTVQEAFEAMFQERATSARALGDRVRAATKHQGSWPKVSVWHGDADPLVRPSNAEDIVRQWTNVHGLSVSPSKVETVTGHMRRVWDDASGDTIMEAFSIAGMAHGVPLATGTGDDRCGVAGPFFLDVGVDSTSRIAQFWGLANVGPKAYSAAETPDITASIREYPRAIETVARDAGADALVGPRVAPDETHAPRMPLDPNAVIAAAFKAAGLPSPMLQINRRSRSVYPGPIIEAALKAAGLLNKLSGGAEEASCTNPENTTDSI
jgi:poly(hydroxyalkanoate) depolymerase family esterase